LKDCISPEKRRETKVTAEGTNFQRAYSKSGKIPLFH